MVKRIIKWSKSKSTLSDKMLLKNNGALASFIFMIILYILFFTIILSTQIIDIPDIIFYIFVVIEIILLLLNMIFDLITA